MNKHSPKVAPAAPAVHTAGRPKLRVLGTAISLLEELRVKAEADLGIDICFDNNDFIVTQHKAAQEPDSYDIYDQCFHNLDIVWYWRAIQPIEIARVPLWGEINDLTKTGQIGPSARLGQGGLQSGHHAERSTYHHGCRFGQWLLCWHEQRWSYYQPESGQGSG